MDQNYITLHTFRLIYLDFFIYLFLKYLFCFWICTVFKLYVHCKDIIISSVGRKDCQSSQYRTTIVVRLNIVLIKQPKPVIGGGTEA